MMTCGIVVNYCTGVRFVYVFTAKRKVGEFNVIVRRLFVAILPSFHKGAFLLIDMRATLSGGN